VTFDPADESPHWFVLDRALGEQSAVRVAGPAWRDVLPPVRREDVLAALAIGLAWQEGNEAIHPNTVLACCRAWRYADEGVISSKVDAAAWARERIADAALVGAALAPKRGEEATLDPDAVVDLLSRTRERLEQG
jgi:hypothetical protein